MTSDRPRHTFEGRFQRWCDTHSFECGKGTICRYCDGNFDGRPCVRALNMLMRQEGKGIDYEHTTNEDAFNI